MRSITSSVTALLLATSSLTITACVMDGEDGDEALGNIGDGKSDSFGVVDKAFTAKAGQTRRFTFEADAAFRLAVTQPTTADADRPQVELTLTTPTGTTTKVGAATEPTLVLDPSENGGAGTFTIAIKNVGTKTASLVLNVRPLGGFGDMPNPNALVYPDATWTPPAVDSWPTVYPIFNNPGCGKTCDQAQQTEMAARSVMIKMLVAAIHNVKDGGIVRVSNFNISPSMTAAPVVDALVWAMQNKHATVKIVMDEAQNVATSKTTWLSQNGAQVRFLNGLAYTNSAGAAQGIMHSKIVTVDDQIVFTGSNNFSGSGFVTNEENSVVMRAPTNSTRIAAFICDVDTMFDTGVAAGQPELTDDARRTQLLALDACNGNDVWFPPTGVTATGDSITGAVVAKAIGAAKSSIALAPDMLANPSLVFAMIARAKKAKSAHQPFSIKLVLDASDEALGNPAFGDCLEIAAAKYGLDVQARYWHGNAAIFQLMHHKFMVIDADDPAGAILYNGSANYSAKAMTYSFENVTRYTGTQYRQIVDAFAARFARMYADGQDKAALAAVGLMVPACPLAESSL
jgi:hypothetical protein